MELGTKFTREEHVFRSEAFKRIISAAVSFLLESPILQLPPPESFVGTGVYALYYTGDFPSYAKIASANRASFTKAIYVGKAVPSGWRQARTNVPLGAELHRRLREHAKSITEGKDLSINHFHCRFMILEGNESDMISTVEAELIRRYTPLWNSCIDGFGNHDPGSGRYDQQPSEWDVLHPGRSWARKLRGIKPSRTLILTKIEQFTAS